MVFNFPQQRQKKIEKNKCKIKIKNLPDGTIIKEVSCCDKNDIEALKEAS